ncbi:MAG TPA: hypothetical protein VGR06_04100 [Actinophytocola sp.]|uniref:hypothetical protein n=1 Tax=Actinophytocola sp. TaxID=1872138 RepID=UPI002E00619C|nr:hypothetical protein [Actinophytocola sp.]
MVGRLLEELSWEGPRVRQYRFGGRGLENVLTAEVLTALDFLPRRGFLGAVLAAAHGADPPDSPASTSRSPTRPLNAPRCCCSCSQPHRRSQSPARAA